MSRLGFGEEHYRGEVLVASCHIQDTWFLTIDVDLDHFVRVAFARSLHCEVISFILFHVTLIRKKSQCIALTYEVESSPPSSWGQISCTNYFNSCTQEIYLLIPIYLVNYLYQCGIIHICFELQSSTTFCFSRFGPWDSFTWFLCPFGTPPPSLCFCSYFIELFIFLLSCESSLFWLQVFYQIYVLQIFSPRLWIFLLFFLWWWWEWVGRSQLYWDKHTPYTSLIESV